MKHESWQFIEKLEKYAGLWPYQSRFKNCAIHVAFTLLIMSMTVPMVTRFRQEWGVNLGIASENICSIMLTTGLLFKVYMASFFGNKRKKSYDKVNDHFMTINESQEASMLDKSAEHSFKFCIKYLIVHFVALAIFTSPIAVKMLYEYFTNNGEFQKIFPYNVDYSCFIDEDKYYSLIILHMSFSFIPFAGMNCACDFPYIMNTRHVCAIFQVVEMRLQEASGFLEKFEWDVMDFASADKKAYELITQAINIHSEAIEMASLIEDAYTYTLCAVLLCSIFFFSGGVYVLLLSIDQPFDFLRYLTLYVALFIQYSILYYHGQIIIDASSSVFDACYDVKWYVASPRTRRLLLIMMLRSSRPCMITGGGFFTISMENCGKMTKCGYSYLSVFNRD